MGLPKLSAEENGNTILDSYDSADDNAYDLWLMQHPSALNTFEQMVNIGQGRKIVIFLDYDGTLSNIVPNPEEAFMTEKMRMTVRDVARCFPTAIVSGRHREKVYNFVRVEDIYYAGSHGLDIAAPLRSLKFGDPVHQTRALDAKGNEIVLFQPAKAYLPTIQKIICELKDKTAEITGALVEDNKFCVSVHYRHVSAEDFGKLEDLMKAVLEQNQGFRLAKGKKVFEIRPDIEWDKGNALEYLLETLGYGSSGDVLPIYIGDDRSDEDAFKVIRKMGNGFPIIVSSIPKVTMALYSLRDPAEVQKFLSSLVSRRKFSSRRKFGF